MTRQYKVTKTSAEGHVEWSMTTADVKDALRSFNAGLEAAGHDDRRYANIQYDLLVAMTGVQDSLTVLDPDYGGQLSFTRSDESRKSQAKG